MHPVQPMDHLSKTKRNSGDQQSLGTSRIILPRVSRSMKLQDKLKPEKPKLSYADFHSEITKTAKYVPHKFAGTPQKQQIGGKEVDEDELVKYMSNLPSYLQRGETVQEKALNVGVLDWGRLEKWQYSHKQMPYRCSKYSTSSSNTSSSLSTDGSSPHSNRGHTYSPARQSTGRPSLQFQMQASPMESSSPVVKSLRESTLKFQAMETRRSGTLNKSEKFISTAPSPFKKHSDVALEECKKNRSDQIRQRDPGSRPLQNDANYEMPSRSTVKVKTQGGECTKREEKTQKSTLKNFEQNSSKGSKTIVLLLPTGLQESNHPSHLQDSNSAVLSGRRSERRQRSFPEGCKTACQDELNSDISHSCPLPSRVGSKESQVEQLDSMNSAATGSNRSSSSSSSLSQPPRVGYNPCSDRNLEAKNSTVLPTCSTSIEHSKALDQKSKKGTAEKVRSTSPFYRFTNGISKMSKGSGLKDSLNVRNQSSTDVSAKSMGKAMSSAGDSSGSDKHRARSSPLRRLLDPLLKPKAENCHHSVEPLEKVSGSTDRACKAADEQHVSLAMRSGKVKLGMTGCKKVNVNELAKDKKHGPSTVQALFRVAVKNGLPLFTFAVNNENNLLAATVKMLNTTKEDGHRCVYTFFTIQDIKKKNGSWINQGSKGNSHDYVSNVVAQMKVSDSGFSNLSTQNKLGVREFVLFSVDLRHTDNQTSEFQPNNELAAIVVKFPKKTNPSSMKDGLPVNPYRVNSEDLNGHSNSVNDVQCQPFFGSQDFISTTVILPSAIHSLPSKGGPSSLIERWSSGGSCDCGGWDLGCKLQILENQNKVHKKLSSSRGCPITDRLELFTQGGVQENQHVFSLSPFKEGIYSVEFNSSLSILQAFSICTAALDSREQCDVLESSNPFEEKTFGDQQPTMLVQNAGTSGPSRVDGEVPRYMSYPPLSPVGRV